MHWLSDPALAQLESPFYLLEHSLLRKNLQKIAAIKEAVGCKVLMALKSFASPGFFPEMAIVLDGTSSSSPLEARLAKESFSGDVHVYAPAFTARALDEILPLATHVTLNSLGQLVQWGPTLKAAGIEVGLRINPEHSETDVSLYDPCRKGSRLGVTAQQLTGADPELLALLDGIHFHNLCENNSPALQRTLKSVENHFAPLLKMVKWINLGGGHLIGEADYDVDLLISEVSGFRQRHQLEVILEPGAGVVVDTGFFASEVLDIFENQGQIAILDSSATAHMPDVLEMPYTPEIFGARFIEDPETTDLPANTYRLGGLTCLAGDEIGTYTFPEPLVIGQRLWFGDMAHYTIIKNTMFNGLPLPAIHYYDQESKQLQAGAEFGYDAYRSRLG